MADENVQDAHAEITRRFKAFDDVASTVVFPETYTEVRDFHAALAPMIDALPQKEHIADETAERWLRITFANELKTAVRERTHYLKARGYSDKQIEEARKPLTEDYRTAFVQTTWHIRRATGIGGSEIGDVIKSYLKETSEGFSTATAVVRSKLLLDPPLPAKEQMQRGHRQEDAILSEYHRVMNAVSDTASIQKVRGHRVRSNPWIIGTPDDIIIREVMIDGELRRRRIIIDSKAPSADVVQGYLDDGGAPFNYCAQLHHYGLVCYDAGVKYAGYEVVPNNPASGRIEILPVTHEPEMLKNIVAAAKWAWDCVMTGVVPEPLAIEEMVLDDDEKVVMSSLVYELQAMKSMGSMVEDMTVNIRSQMETLVGDRIGKFSPAVAYGDFKVTVDYDIKELLRLKEAAPEIDDKPFRKPGKKAEVAKVESAFVAISDMDNMEDVRNAIERLVSEKTFADEGWDANALANALSEAGIDIASARKLKRAYSSTRKRSGPEKAVYDRFNEKTGMIAADLPSFFREDEIRKEILDGAPVMEEQEPSEDDEVRVEP